MRSRPRTSHATSSKMNDDYDFYADPHRRYYPRTKPCLKCLARIADDEPVDICYFCQIVRILASTPAKVELEPCEEF